MTGFWEDSATPLRTKKKKKEKRSPTHGSACFLRQLQIETHFLCLNLVTRCNWVFLTEANVNCDSEAAKIFLLVGRLGYCSGTAACCLHKLTKLLEDAGRAEVFCRFRSQKDDLRPFAKRIWTSACNKRLPCLAIFLPVTVFSVRTCGFTVTRREMDEKIREWPQTAGWTEFKMGPTEKGGQWVDGHVSY